MPEAGKKSLAAISERFEDDLLRREAAGDPTAPLARIQPPWLLEQLGAPISDGKRLAKIEASVLRQGRLRRYAESGDPFEWIRGAKNLCKAFLNFAMSSDGAIWTDFLEARRSVLDAEPGFDRPQIRREVMRTLCDLRDRAWHEAFTEGRILVFREFDKAFEFQPPHMWAAGPPFPLFDSDDLEDLVPNAQAGIAEEDQHNFMFSSIADSIRDSLGLNSDLAQLSSFRKAPPSILPGTRLNSNRCAFLIAADIPRKLFQPGAPPPDRTALGKVFEARRWFRTRAWEIFGNGLRASKEDTLAVFAEMFALPEEQASEIWSTQAPQKWFRSGRIPSNKKYSYPELSGA